MKSVYRLGDDIFIATAFVTFIIAVVTRLLGFSQLWLGVTVRNILTISVICLLFSIALSLYDLNAKR